MNAPADKAQLAAGPLAGFRVLEIGSTVAGPFCGRLLADLGSEPVHVRGDLFEARPRRNVPEKDKPTPAQRRARAANVKKAQAARHGHGA